MKSPDKPDLASLRFFLGGRDLEMLAIRQLLDAHAPGQSVDRDLAWGAKVSDHAADIDAALAEGRTPVLVELADDVKIAASPRGIRVVVVDHHGELAGAGRPTSLEQVFRLLGRPENEWTRDLQLIAANDRGHVAEMQSLDATVDELRDIRQRDRAAQGISPEEEVQGRAAAEQVETLRDGELTVATLPHHRTATVTDALELALGGPGYRNLLILSPGKTHFFGSGAMIDRLRAAFPGGYYGGRLPEAGYWGLEKTIRRDDAERALFPLDAPPHFGED